MRSTLSAFALFALAAAPLLAHADTIESFTVSGTGSLTLYPDPQPPNYNPPTPVPLKDGVASGAFTFDFTTDTVLASTVKLSNGKYDITDALDLTALVPGDPSPTCVEENYVCQTGTLDASGGFFYLEDDTQRSGRPSGRIGQIYSATLTPSAPTGVTPEPSSMALLGTGLLGVAGMLRLRRNAGAFGR